MRKLYFCLAIFIFIFTSSNSSSQEVSPWIGEWIWSEQGVKENYFRCTFNIEKNNPPVEGKIAITCDNVFELYLNGEFIGRDEDWATVEVYDIKSKIRVGKNVIAVKCIDPGGDCGALLVEGYVKLKNGIVKIIASDENWKMAQEIPPSQLQHWKELYYDDTTWRAAKPYGKPPMPPWGALSYPSFGKGNDVLVNELKISKGTPLPGNKINLSCKITPKAKGVMPTTIGIKLLKEDEVVFEKYWDAAFAFVREITQQWAVDKTISFTIEDVYLPKYCPLGNAAIELIIPGYRTDKTCPIKIGPEEVIHVPRAKIIAKDITIKDGYLKAKLYIKSGTDEPLYVQIYKGRDILAFADTVPLSTELNVKISTLPKGEYYLKLCQHKALCADCKLYKFKIYDSKNENESMKPLGYGEYRDRFGVPHRWYINHCNTLIRDGKPYIPVGGMYISAFHNNFNVADIENNEKNWERDMEKLSLLVSAGVSDLYLNPCVKWGGRPAWLYQRLFDAMEEKGIYYGWQVTSPMSPLKGFSICLDKYSLEIEGPGTYNVDIIPSWLAHVNEHTKVFYSVVNNTTGEIIAAGSTSSVSPIKGGIRATVSVSSLRKGEKATIYCIPEITFTGDMHDYWTDFNKEYENSIKTVLKKVRLGEKFVCFIDPLDNEQSLRDEHQLLPSCEAFQKMLSAFLKNKYKTISNLAHAWALMDKAPAEWASCGRLIPIGRGKKGTMYEDIGYVIDMTTNTVYKIDLRKSQIWYDILEFRNSSIRDFNNRAADIFKSVHNVPVVLKLTGEDCFTNNKEVGGFDGVGFEAYGKGNELIRGCGGGVFSRAAQAARTMWCLVTETNMSGPEEEHVGYTDPLRLVEELNIMVAGGAKGVYVFYFNACATGKPHEFYNFDLFHDERQLYWLGAYSQLLKSSHKLPSYKADVDFLFPAKQHGMDGFRRAQPDFYGPTPETSILGNEGRWAVPCSTIPKTDNLHVIVNLIDTPITERHKAILEELIKKNVKVTFIGFRKDLGALPFIDKYYTNIITTDSDNKEVQILNPDERCNILARTADNRMLPWAIEVDNIRIFAKDDFENIVKAATRPPERKINFLNDILDAEARTYGKAVLSLSFGDTTYLWNTLSQDAYLRITTKNELKYMIGGNSFKWHGKMNIKIPKLLSLPTIIKGLSGEDNVEGIDEINKLYALEKWNKIASKGKQLELNVPDITGLSEDEILKTAEMLEKQVKEKENTTYFYRNNNVVLDGDLSEWENIPPIYLTVKVMQDFTIPCEYKDARFYLGYDDENLYIAGEVNDEAVVNLYRGKMIWNGDAIEVFVDINPDMETTYDGYTEYCYQFLFSPTNADSKPDMAVAGNPKLEPTYAPHNNKVAAKIHTKGYNIECAINYKELGGWKPKTNAKIGFSLALDDADSGDRTVQYLWRGKGDLWRVRTRFGKAILR